jgi:hypothetical protein
MTAVLSDDLRNPFAAGRHSPDSVDFIIGNESTVADNIGPDESRESALKRLFAHMPPSIS